MGYDLRRVLAAKEELGGWGRGAQRDRCIKGVDRRVDTHSVPLKAFAHCVGYVWETLKRTALECQSLLIFGN